MKINCWHKNGSLKTLLSFCNQNQDRPISVKLTNRSEPVKGALHGCQVDSSKTAGLFLLLTDRVTHPAYYSLDDIESIHSGLSVSLSPWSEGKNMPFRDRTSMEAAASGCSDP